MDNEPRPQGRLTEARKRLTSNKNVDISVEEALKMTEKDNYEVDGDERTKSAGFYRGSISSLRKRNPDTN